MAIPRGSWQPRPRQRKRNGLIALGLVVIFTWLFFTHSGSQTPSQTSSQAAKQHDDEQYDDSTSVNGQLWQILYPFLTDYAPQCDPPLRQGSAESVTFDPSNAKYPPKLLDMSGESVGAMREAHRLFVKAIKRDIPTLPYQPGTRGLVSTAGGEYLPVLVASLRMLRRTGTKLPMEVFLAHWNEYEGYICDVVLPSLNARCVVLSEILDVMPGSHGMIQKFQYKPLAMLFSSFEDILFLDADAFPIHNPEVIFNNNPFTSKGLVTWPDFWAPTIAHQFYEIISQDRPAPNLRQSTESGAVLISRKTHLHTILLATYYNFWGPSYYYPILSQGASGEGDKETFLAAATALKQPFYQVRQSIRALGRHTRNGFAGSTMIQYNPIDDYLLMTKKKKIGETTAPAPFFVHANYPKFNPATIFRVIGPVMKEDGSYTRAWTAPEDVVESFGTDLERQYWAEIRWTGCKLEGKLIGWRGQTGICGRVEDYYNIIFA